MSWGSRSRSTPPGTSSVAGRRLEGPPVLVGSHLDTVPTGGRFDGVLGVVAAIHAVARLKAEGFEPDRPLWVVAFMDEEGTRFNAALFGSRAFAGADLDRARRPCRLRGATLREAMADAGHDLDRVGDADSHRSGRRVPRAPRRAGPGPRGRGSEIGVVTSIVGLRGYRVRLRGEANHAGTTPMGLRRDALVGAARIAIELRDVAATRGRRDRERRQDRRRAGRGERRPRPGGLHDRRPPRRPPRSRSSSARRGDRRARSPRRRASVRSSSRPSP